MEWRNNEGVPWLEAGLGHGARVAFGTRLGGVSEPPFDGLNLGMLTDDAPVAVIENRLRLARALGLDPERILIGLQVHGGQLATHSAPQRPGPFAHPGSDLPEVDGHVATVPGLAPLVFTADCLPVALAGPGGVAMLHCGWRGLAAGIVTRATEAVTATGAAVGPGIGACCYEVGDEVLDAFAHLGPGITAADKSKTEPGARKSARPHLDLAEVATRLLQEAGVERVEVAGLCTKCESELFFSHRREAGRTGRQGSLAWIEAG